jgi:hypothetical protein
VEKAIKEVRNKMMMYLEMCSNYWDKVVWK